MFPGPRCGGITFLTSQALTLISTAAFSSLSGPSTRNSTLKPLSVKASSCFHRSPEPLCRRAPERSRQSASLCQVRVNAQPALGVPGQAWPLQPGEPRSSCPLPLGAFPELAAQPETSCLIALSLSRLTCEKGITLHSIPASELLR